MFFGSHAETGTMSKHCVRLRYSSPLHCLFLLFFSRASACCALASHISHLTRIIVIASPLSTIPPISIFVPPARLSSNARAHSLVHGRVFLQRKFGVTGGSAMFRRTAEWRAEGGAAALVQSLSVSFLALRSWRMWNLELSFRPEI
ncbi:hypothetical protein DE146DRAFT_648061 [Phaeosphaeria sp. MPI-PUGE-AT-0046c]|nr:hypothetical protein DE146DRAFT_648061 [Phaeosphaeria sp. MPI-PUGE-AT-0046c]